MRKSQTGSSATGVLRQNNWAFLAVWLVPGLDGQAILTSEQTISALRSGEYQPERDCDDASTGDADEPIFRDDMRRGASRENRLFRSWCLGRSSQQALVDFALHIDVEADPGLAVDQVNQAAQLSRILDPILGLAEDHWDEPGALA